MTGSVHPCDLGFHELRLERSVARRTLELAQMRSAPHDAAAEEALLPLRERVRELTDELIGRYSRDLALIDLLLDSPYPARGSAGGAPTASGGEVTP